MEFLDGNHPPHIAQVSQQELKSWELGQISLTPDQVAAARYLQTMLASRRQFIQGEVVSCHDVVMQTLSGPLGSRAIALITA